MLWAFPVPIGGRALYRREQFSGEANERRVPLSENSLFMAARAYSFELLQPVMQWTDWRKNS